MNNLKAPSLQSLLESDRGSTDSLLAESLQLDFDEVYFFVNFCLHLKKKYQFFFVILSKMTHSWTTLSIYYLQ